MSKDVNEIKKEFEKRNDKKIDIHLSDDITFHIKEREVWYVFLGQNVGYEQNGKTDFTRPVLVIKKIGNMIFSVPMTMKGKENNYYKKIESINFGKPSFLNISQGRVIDSKRFSKKIGTISENEFIEIKKILKDVYLTGI